MFFVLIQLKKLFQMKKYTIWDIKLLTISCNSKEYRIYYTKEKYPKTMKEPQADFQAIVDQYYVDTCQELFANNI